MAKDAARQKRNKTERSRAVIRGLAAFSFAAAVAFAGYQALMHSDTPLPRAWNPTRDLVISDPVTPLTPWKLGRAAGDFDKCLTALADFAAVTPLEPLEETAQCFVRDRVLLRGLADASVAPVETRCAIALRMAMWERHSVQPAAERLLGSPVARIRQIGSYNCRAMRTIAGPSTRMSTHATADAIDITGFDLVDGTRISLLDDWAGTGQKATFLRTVRNGACEWFNLTLSPDYNRLHADHFHLQSRGWGLCR